MTFYLTHTTIYKITISIWENRLNRQIQIVVMALLQMKILFLFVNMAAMVPIRKLFCTNEEG